MISETPMTRRIAAVLAATFGFGIASIAATRNPTPTPPIQRTAADSDEIALGAALVTQFDADRGVAPTPQTRRIEAYLQTIAESLGRHTRRKLPWRIHYDPHPGIKSGFALPG